MSLKLALDIGCGERKVSIPGYSVQSLDIRPEVRPDFIASIEKIPCPDESYDLLFASHVLEHVERVKVYNVLKEWRRALKVGGILQLVVPDLEIAAIELLSCRTSNDTFDILWGAQNYPSNFHYCGFTWQLLEATVKKYGFKVIKTECKDRQIFMTAEKLGGAYIE